MSLEDPYFKLWTLVKDLSEQLSQNREVTSSLQAQISQIKTQAVHSNAGFPLRRFNTDISQEEFTSSLEEFSAKLVSENRSLQHENKQLSILLREYETTLERVMSNFRGLAHSTQTHELELHNHYTTALMALSHAQGEAALLESTELGGRLVLLGELVRRIIRLEGGEAVGQGLRDTGDIGPQGGYLPPSERPPAYTNSEPLGETRLDWALERESEILRLEAENRALREMLGLGEGSAVLNGSTQTTRPDGVAGSAAVPPADVGR